MIVLQLALLSLHTLPLIQSFNTFRPSVRDEVLDGHTSPDYSFDLDPNRLDANEIYDNLMDANPEIMEKKEEKKFFDPSGMVPVFHSEHDPTEVGSEPASSSSSTSFSTSTSTPVPETTTELASTETATATVVPEFSTSAELESSAPFPPTATADASVTNAALDRNMIKSHPPSIEPRFEDFPSADVTDADPNESFIHALSDYYEEDENNEDLIFTERIETSESDGSPTSIDAPPRDRLPSVFPLLKTTTSSTPADSVTTEEAPKIFRYWLSRSNTTAKPTMIEITDASSSLIPPPPRDRLPSVFPLMETTTTSPATRVQATIEAFPPRSRLPAVFPLLETTTTEAPTTSTTEEPVIWRTATTLAPTTVRPNTAKPTTTEAPEVIRFWWKATESTRAPTTTTLPPRRRLPSVFPLIETTTPRAPTTTTAQPDWARKWWIATTTLPPRQRLPSVFSLLSTTTAPKQSTTTAWPWWKASPKPSTTKSFSSWRSTTTPSPSTTRDFVWSTTTTTARPLPVQPQPAFKTTAAPKPVQIHKNRGPTFNCRVLNPEFDGRASPANDWSCKMLFPGIPKDSSCKCTYEVEGRDERGCATGYLYTCVRIH